MVIFDIMWCHKVQHLLPLSRKLTHDSTKELKGCTLILSRSKASDVYACK